MRASFKLLYSKKWLFFCLLGLILFGIIVIFLFDKENLHLTINRYNNSFFDIFFKYATYLGDGIIFPIAIIGLLLVNRKSAPAFIYAGILTLIISYILKHWFFTGYARPYEVFKNSIHLIDGVKMRHWHSFPSGHTTAAFALFISAILFTKNKYLQILWLSLAVIAGLSRVYLSQHFLIDVIAGAILGTLIALVAYQIFLRFPLFRK